MTIKRACELLTKKKHHILSKDYHDGHGRQYWLRDENQNDISELTEKQFLSISKRLKNLVRENIISSDLTYWYEIKDER